jgi:hypothetical protein
MASKRLLDKRREYEAAEKQGKTSTTKKAAAKKGAKSSAARKRKVKAPERKRLMWGVFSGTLKEEGRFLWNEREKAEERLALLRSKSKKLYFIQPIKESISDSAKPTDDVAPILDDEEEILDEDAVLEDEYGEDFEDEDDDLDDSEEEE